MQLRNIALNNLRRRRGKAVFMLCGMVFAIATIVSLHTITTSMEAGMEDKFQQMGTKVIVAPQTNSVSLSYGGITIPSKVAYDVKEIDMADLGKIEAFQQGNQDIGGLIINISPKVLGKASLNSSSVLAVGVDFEKELKARPYWEIDGRTPKAANEVLLGKRTADKHRLRVGDKFSLTGQEIRAQAVVSGIIGETGSEEDGLLFMNLNEAQKLLGKEGKISFVELKVAAGEAPLNEITRALTEALPEAKVKTVKEAVEARKEIIDRFGKFSIVVSFIMLLIGILMVVTTMLSAVNERTREIGIFRAIGFRKSHIIKVILLEAGIISGFSGLFGYLIGFGTAVLLAPKIAQMEISVAWNPFLSIIVVLASVALGLLASLYPASRAAKLDPVEALRFM